MFAKPAWLFSDIYTTRTVLCKQWIFNTVCVSLAVQSAVSAPLLKCPCNTNITTAKVMFLQVWI